MMLKSSFKTNFKPNHKRDIFICTPNEFIIVTKGPNPPLNGPNNSSILGGLPRMYNHD